jgi:Beta-propeller repeat
VTKLDAAGSKLVYSTYLGGTSQPGDFLESGNAIAVDWHRNAYITGITPSTDFPTKNAFQGSLKATASFTAFVTKLDANGNALLYSTYLGGSRGDSGNGIAVDVQEDAYVTGTTASSDFPIKDAFKGKLKPQAQNAFVTKFDAAGTALVYSTFLGGSRSDSGSGIAVDAHGNAYVTGTTTSSDFPTRSAFQNKQKSPCTPLTGICGNAFLTKFSPTGSVFHSSYFGGSGGRGRVRHRSGPPRGCISDRPHFLYRSPHKRCISS